MVPKRLLGGFLVVAGTVFLAIGVIGIVIPLLPTTPFLLLGAACYLRGSKRMYGWLLSNRWLGGYIRDYREGRGIPLRIKILTLCLLWVTIGYSGIYIVSIGWARVALLAIVIGVTYHILKIGTTKHRFGTP